MQTAEITDYEPVTVERENIVHLPLGLLGFERIKRYVLLTNAEEAPFHWLQVLDDPTLAFLVVSPFEVMPEYNPDLSEEDVEFIGLSSPSDALMYNIVTLRGKGRGTVNLKGPIILNRYTLTGKQVVPLNAAQFSLQYPLPVTE